ncbi:MAG: tRNA pseudouridine(13) synthase TruD [Gammaproteobacteria bacterium]|nr:tRNA pseudouridine(13) synthase TruD [Gammaproteobacteria bacterium]
MSYPPLSDLAYFTGKPAVRAMLRAAPEDFQVDEELGFSPDGKGEHVMLRVRKRNTNTEWVARLLAKLSNVRMVDVGYAGLKDRRAVTTQWFSVKLGKQAEPDWLEFADADVQVLLTGRHSRKIRRGALRGNRFAIILRDLRGDLSELSGKLEQVKKHGIPNYFGEQRFGRTGENVERAAALFTGALEVRSRHKRGLYLSAARSLLFNCVLSRRVGDLTWNKALPGDVMLLAGSQSVFALDKADEEIEKRIALGDIHPTGPMWGRGEPMSGFEPRTLEMQMAETYPVLAKGLEQAGLKQARRSLRLSIENLEWEFLASDTLRLDFFLPAGAYASSVLRELVISKYP